MTITMFGLYCTQTVHSSKFNKFTYVFHVAMLLYDIMSEKGGVSDYAGQSKKRGQITTI